MKNARFALMAALVFGLVGAPSLVAAEDGSTESSVETLKKKGNKDKKKKKGMKRVTKRKASYALQDRRCDGRCEEGSR
jgi:hypothetical protein